MFFILLAILLPFAVISAHSGHRWTHNDHRSRNWNNRYDYKDKSLHCDEFKYSEKYYWNLQYKQYCGGKVQSPINIVTKNVKPEGDPSQLDLSNYKFPVTPKEIINNGHTVKISVRETVSIALQNNKTSYVLDSFHFHLGRYHNDGSEHTIDGRGFAMELHFVHRKSTFATTSEAIASNEKDALLVVGVLLEQGYENKELNFITTNVRWIRTPDTELNYNYKINLSELLPGKETNPKYYTYSGSLTTPDCNEVVSWFVIAKKSSISKYQLQSLRMLEANCKESMAGNVRPVQPLNGRTVFRNF